MGYMIYRPREERGEGKCEYEVMDEVKTKQWFRLRLKRGAGTFLLGALFFTGAGLPPFFGGMM